MRAVGKFNLRAGFTLLELLMVVVIIGVLFGILMPVINNMKVNALNKQRESEARLIESAIRNYHAEKGEWPMDPNDKPKLAVEGVVYSIHNTKVFDPLLQCTPSLLDTNNMSLGSGDFYRQPGTTNTPWVIIISNSTVTVQWMKI